MLLCWQWCTSVSHLTSLSCGLCFLLCSCPWPFLVRRRGAHDGPDCTVTHSHWAGHGRKRWRVFPIILHKLHRVLTWQCLLVSFRVIWRVTEGRGEQGQSMFSGTCGGIWQRVGQRQLRPVAFLAGLFAAFLASCLETAAIICCWYFFSSCPPPLSTASLKLLASNRILDCTRA